MRQLISEAKLDPTDGIKQFWEEKGAQSPATQHGSRD